MVKLSDKPPQEVKDKIENGPVFFKLGAEMLSRKDLRLPAKVILAILQNRIPYNGKIGVRLLSQIAGISFDATRRAIAELETLGELLISRGRRGQRSLYSLPSDPKTKRTGIRSLASGNKVTSEREQGHAKNENNTSSSTARAKKEPRVRWNEETDAMWFDPKLLETNKAEYGPLGVNVAVEKVNFAGWHRTHKTWKDFDRAWASWLKRSVGGDDRRTRSPPTFTPAKPAVTYRKGKQY